MTAGSWPGTISLVLELAGGPALTARLSHSPVECNFIELYYQTRQFCDCDGSIQNTEETHKHISTERKATIVSKP